MTTDESQLGVHVFNGGKGEGIILELPDGRCGVIDAYASSLQDASSNSVVNWLKRRVPVGQKLAFVCMTHPHDDHYRGLGQILDQWGTDRLWRFGAMSQAEGPPASVGGREERPELALACAVHSSARLCLGTAAADARRTSALELTRVLQKYDAASRVVPLSCDVREIVDVQVLYPSGGGGGTDEECIPRIISCGPSTAMKRKYEAVIREFVLRPEQTLLEQRAHNDVSVGLIVSFGKSTLVLGGDIESKGWEEALRLVGRKSVQATIVKVSHHGSVTGYCDGLWETFGTPKVKLAIVTPYHRFRLPRREAVAHIQQYSERLVMTCKPAREVLLSEKELVMRLVTGARDPVPAMAIVCGRVSAYMDAHGNVGGVELADGAYEM